MWFPCCLCFRCYIDNYLYSYGTEWYLVNGLLRAMVSFVCYGNCFRSVTAIVYGSASEKIYDILALVLCWTYGYKTYGYKSVYNS